MTATSVLAGYTTPKGITVRQADAGAAFIEFARREPHLYDPDFIDHFQDLIDRIEAQAAAD